MHVYDNASGDETPEVVAQFAARDPRVKYHVHPRNIGMMDDTRPSHSRHALFQHSERRRLPAAGFFDAAIDNLTANPEPGFFFGGLLFFDGAKAVAAGRSLEYRGKGRAVDNFRALFPGNNVEGSGSLFRTAAVAALSRK